MELDLDPKVINEYVASKIIESSIGEALRVEIDAQVKKLTHTYGDSPVRSAVLDHIRQATYEYLNTPEMKAKLRAAVLENITDEFLTSLAGKVTIGSY